MDFKSRLQTYCEHKQTDIRRDTQRSQHGDDISTGPELLAVQSVLADFGKELFVPCASRQRHDIKQPVARVARQTYLAGV